MRRIVLAILLIALPAMAEQKVEHGGRAIVTFDVPEVEYRGSREGKLTRTFFSNPVGDGNLKITIYSKGWMSELKAEQRYENDKREKRRDPHARLDDSPEIPGALKTLTYSVSSPYTGRGVVVYTKDFRCELLVTGTKQAAEQVEPTFRSLLSSLKVVPRTNIGELKIE